MNLHEIRFNGATQWLWTDVYGGNGRRLGPSPHLYEIAEGTPPTEIEPMPTWASTRWWRPRRFLWRPFNDNINMLFTHGYVTPLCGRQSRSRYPSARQAHQNTWTRTCPNCLNRATLRGIVPAYLNNILETHHMTRQLQEEKREWIAAHQPA